MFIFLIVIIISPISSSIINTVALYQKDFRDSHDMKLIVTCCSWMVGLE